jgi:hypothetical protein
MAYFGAFLALKGGKTLKIVETTHLALFWALRPTSRVFFLRFFAFLVIFSLNKAFDKRLLGFLIFGQKGVSLLNSDLLRTMTLLFLTSGVLLICL